MATQVTQAATGNSFIDALLDGRKWDGAITFSFPLASTDYPGPPYGDNEEATTGFNSVSAQQRIAVRAIILGTGSSSDVINATSLSSFLAVTFTESGFDGSGDIRIAQSTYPNTAKTYYPNNNADGSGGDLWFGTGYDYRNPVAGSYAYQTHIHELGHALGLKHSHVGGGVSNLALPGGSDGKNGMEFSVMSYLDYSGDADDDYQTTDFNFPQTFMQYDIQALQTMYGADYGPQSHNGNTVYRWSPTTGEMLIDDVSQGKPGANIVFLTIWDGGGNDLYYMGNYTTPVVIDLRPGLWSITSNAQRAHLEDGKMAKGCVYNAFMFGDDERSLIERACGGSAGDYIRGNKIDNVLVGLAGNDTINGFEKKDTIRGDGGADRLGGGTGSDTFVYSFVSDSRGAAYDRIIDFARGTDKIDLVHIDANIKAAGNQAFRWIGAQPFHKSAGELHYVRVGSNVMVEGDIDGNGTPDLRIFVHNLGGLGATDFTL